MTEAQKDLVINVLATLVASIPVGVVMILFDAPTWGWTGIGLLTYLTLLPRITVATQKGKR